MGDSRFQKKESPLWIGKTLVDFFKNEIRDWSLICLGKLWAGKAQVYHIAPIKVFLKLQGPIDVHLPTPKLVLPT